MSGFKLNFESQFDIVNAIFCFNFSLYWCCSWHTMKKKGNDQDLTKYLINDVALSRLCVSVYGLQTVLSLVQSVPYPHPPPKQSVPCPTPTPTTPPQKKRTEGSLCICRDGSVSIFSEFIDY